MGDQRDLMVLPASALAAADLAKRRRSTSRSHPDLPGTGPTGETCKSCANLARLQYAKVYLKCELMRAYWTGGPGTDVRAGDPACRRWERKETNDGKPEEPPTD